MIRTQKSRFFSSPLLLLFTLLCLVCVSPSLRNALADDDLKDDVSIVLSQRGNQNPIQRTALRDMLSFEWVKKKILEKPEIPTVFFAVGNYSQKTRESWPVDQYENVVQVVRSFLEQGYRIVYDKDSPVLTEIMHTEVKPRCRLGISGETLRPQEGERLSTTRTVVIQNPWLHLKTLLGFKKVFLTPDSFIGIALVLKGVPLKNGPELYSFADSVQKLGQVGEWAQDLGDGHSTDRGLVHAIPLTPSKPIPVLSWFSSWFGLTSAPSLNPPPSEGRRMVNLRIQYPKERFPQNVDSVFREDKPDGDVKAFPPFHLETFAEKLDEKTLTQTLDFSKDYLKHFNETNQGLKKGATVFGSGDDVPLYRKLLEESVRVLVQEGGFPIATGGMGGYMAVANRVATELGGESIGIPGIKKDDAPLEVEVFHQYHTRTIPVKGYEERIPFLLSRGGEYVVYAPGGPGTIQELATHLVQIAGRQGETAPLIFLDRDYYWGLVSWLQDLPFSESFRHKIFLIHDAEDLRLKIQAKRMLFSDGAFPWTYL